MENTTVSTISLSITFLIISIVFMLSPFISLSNVYMGVAISKEDRKSDVVKKITKQYFATSIFVAVLTQIFIVFMSFNYPDLLDLFLGIFIFVIVFIHGIIYSIAFSKVKAFKNTLSSSHTSGKSKSIIDTKFIEAKNRIIGVYFKIGIVPVLVNIGLIIYVLLSYNSIPDVVPIHFNAAGVIDAVTDKSYLLVLGLPVLSLLLSITFMFIVKGTFSMHSKISSLDLKKCQDIALSYVKAQCLCITVLNFATAFMFTTITLATVAAANLNIVFMIVSVILLLGSLIYMLYSNIVYKNKLAPFKTEDVGTQLEDEDFWIFGLFYNNKNDARTFVSKRSGMGYTFNIATNTGKIFLVSTILLIIFALCLPFIL